MVTIDDGGNKLVSEPPKKKSTWISTELFTLSADDRETLLNPVGWLNDRLVSAAQSMLRNQFQVLGMQDTSLGHTLAFDILTTEFVQILHDGHAHWLLVRCHEETPIISALTKGYLQCSQLFLGEIGQEVQHNKVH